MNYTRPKNLKPFVIIENFQLYGGFCEGEIGIDPAHFNVAEYVPGQIFKNLLEVSFSNDLGFFNIFGSDLLDSISADTLHLMECRIVCAVYSVFTIDITNA